MPSEGDHMFAHILETNKLVSRKDIDDALALVDRVQDLGIPMNLADVLLARGALTPKILTAAKELQAKRTQTPLPESPASGIDPTRDEDISLGKLLLQNRLLGKEPIEKCLQVQKDLAALGLRYPLGRILVERGLVSRPLIEALLTIQRRHRDPKSVTGPVTLTAQDLLFGRIAVDNNLIATAQLQEAIEFQRTMLERAGICPRLGEVFYERGDLSIEEIDTVLELQKARYRAGDLPLIKAQTHSFPDDVALGRILTTNRVLSDEQLKKALDVQEQLADLGIAHRLGEVLLLLKLTTMQDIHAALQVQVHRRARRKAEARPHKSSRKLHAAAVVSIGAVVLVVIVAIGFSAWNSAERNAQDQDLSGSVAAAKASAAQGDFDAAVKLLEEARLRLVARPDLTSQLTTQIETTRKEKERDRIGSVEEAADTALAAADRLAEAGPGAYAEILAGYAEVRSKHPDTRASRSAAKHIEEWTDLRDRNAYPVYTQLNEQVRRLVLLDRSEDAVALLREFARNFAGASRAQSAAERADDLEARMPELRAERTKNEAKWARALAEIAALQGKKDWAAALTAAEALLLSLPAGDDRRAQVRATAEQARTALADAAASREEAGRSDLMRRIAKLEKDGRWEEALEICREGLREYAGSELESTLREECEKIEAAVLLARTANRPEEVRRKDREALVAARTEEQAKAREQYRELLARQQEIARGGGILEDRTVRDSGDPAGRFDVVIISAGHLATDQGAFQAASDRRVKALLAGGPLAPFAGVINVHRLFLVDEKTAGSSLERIPFRQSGGVPSIDAGVARQYAQNAPEADLTHVLVPGPGQPVAYETEEVVMIPREAEDEDVARQVERVLAGPCATGEPCRPRDRSAAEPCPSCRSSLLRSLYARIEVLNSAEPRLPDVAIWEDESLTFRAALPPPGAIPAPVEVTWWVDGRKNSAKEKGSEETRFEVGPRSLPAGAHAIALRAEVREPACPRDDGTLSFARGWNLTVLPGSRPRIRPPDKEPILHVGDPVAVVLRPTVLPLPKGTTWEIVEKPPGSTFHAALAALAWLPTHADAGLWRIRFRASCEGCVREDAYELAVRRKNFAGFAPVLAGAGAVLADECSAIALHLAAQDADGDRVLFRMTEGPPGAALDPATGQFSWKPDLFQAGSHTLRFEAYDADGSDAITVPITVRNRSVSGGRSEEARREAETQWAFIADGNLGAASLVVALRSGAPAVRAQALDRMRKQPPAWQTLAALRLSRDDAPEVARRARVLLEDLLQTLSGPDRHDTLRLLFQAALDRADAWPGDSAFRAYLVGLVADLPPDTPEDVRALAEKTASR